MVYFKNLHQTLIRFIEDADFQLDIVVCWFTHPQIFEALLLACRRKVKVRLMLNFDQINFHPQGLPFEQLVLSGAEVYAYTAPDLCHHKYVVADQQRVLSGSYNWTRANQQDHLLQTESCQLAILFIRQFEEMQLFGSPLSQLAGQTPKQSTFVALYQPLWWRWTDLKKQIARGANIWITPFENAESWNVAAARQQHLLPLKPGEQLFLSWQSEALDVMLQGVDIKPARRILLQRYLQKVQVGDVLLAVSSLGEVLGLGLVAEGQGVLTEPSLYVYRFVSWRALPQNKPGLVVARPGRVPIRAYRHSGMALLEQLITSCSPSEFSHSV